MDSPHSISPSSSSSSSSSAAAVARIYRPWLADSVPTVPSPMHSVDSQLTDHRRSPSSLSSTSSDDVGMDKPSASSSPALSIVSVGSVDTAADCAARINERLFAGMQHFYPTQHHQHHYVMPAAFPSVDSMAMYGAPFNPAAAAAAAAAAADFMHMEQAYQRVLAEEAAAKQLQSARKQRPKKHKCPHCDVSFSNNGQLQGHIRSHTGERPFRCEEDACGKAFTRNEELTRHKRIHSGVRPFPCATCGKAFGRRDHLKKHQRTHMPAYQQQQHSLLQQQQMQAEAAAAMMMYPYLYGC